MDNQVYTSPEKRTFKFNDHVVVEMLLGVPDELRTGRLVQVRKGVGGFRSDMYFIRRRDGTLCTFENAMIRHVGDKDFEHAFYISNGRQPPVVPDQQPDDADDDQQVYSIREQWPEKGFIIEHPKQPESEHQSFTIVITQGEPKK